MQCVWSVQCTIVADLCKLHQSSLLHSSYYCIEMQEQPDVGFNEKELPKWKGNKLVEGSKWDELKSSVCLIDYHGTGTGFIGEKCGNLYLVTCWHTFETKKNEKFSATALWKRSREQECMIRFSHFMKNGQMKGSDLLLNERPIGKQVCVK